MRRTDSRSSAGGNGRAMKSAAPDCTASTIIRGSGSVAVTRIGVPGDELLQGVQDIGHLRAARAHVEDDRRRRTPSAAACPRPGPSAPARGCVLGQGVGEGLHLVPEFADDENAVGHRSSVHRLRRRPAVPGRPAALSFRCHCHALRRM